MTEDIYKTVLNRYFVNESKTFVVKPIRVIYSRMDDEIICFEYKVIWSTSKINEHDFVGEDNFYSLSLSHYELWEVKRFLKKNNMTPVEFKDIEKFKMMQELRK